MAQPSQDILPRIEALLRAGRQQESRFLLLEYLESNPDSTQAWWLLSQVAGDADQQADCFERILQLEPENASARAGLASLQELAAQSPLSSPALFGEMPGPSTSGAIFTSATEEDSHEAVLSPLLVAPAPETADPILSAKPKKKSPRLGMLLTALFIIILLLLGAFYLWTGRKAQASADNTAHLQQTQAVAALLAQLHTSTAPATSTPAPSITLTLLSNLTPTLDQRFTVTPPAADQFLPLAGYYAPSFKLKDIKTAQWITLSQFAGQPVLLYFCDITTSACRDELDTVKALGQNYAGRDLVILGIISGEDAAAVALYQKSEQPAYPILLDLDNKAKKLYQVESIPAFYFIDPTGKITSIETGALSYPQIVKKLAAILP